MCNSDVLCVCAGDAMAEEPREEEVMVRLATASGAQIITVSMPY